MLRGKDLKYFHHEEKLGTSLVVQWLRFHLPMQGVRVPSWELRSHMPRGQKPKQKQYCNKFNKDFKNFKKRKKAQNKRTINSRN